MYPLPAFTLSESIVVSITKNTEENKKTISAQIKCQTTAIYFFKDLRILENLCCYSNSSSDPTLLIVVIKL